MITAILSAIAGAEALLQSLWAAHNNAPMLQAKVAQMTEEDKAKHNEVLDKAMHGDAVQRQQALDELRKLVSE